MATVIVAAWQAGKAGQSSRSQVLGGTPRAVHVITSSASNQVSTVRANVGEVLMVSVNGGPVELAYATGADPDAASTPHFVIADGGSLPVEALADDFRVAVVDA